MRAHSYYSIVHRAVPGCPLHQEFGLGEHCRRLLHYHNKGTDAQSVCSFYRSSWSQVTVCFVPGRCFNWSEALYKIVCLSDFSGIHTASSCDGPICCVPKLVAGSFQQFEYVSTQPAFVELQHLRHAFGISTCMLNYFAVTFSYDTLILTVCRALLKSAIAGAGHQSYITKKTHVLYSLNKVLNVNGSGLSVPNVIWVHSCHVNACTHFEFDFIFKWLVPHGQTWQVFLFLCSNMK